MRSSKPQAVLVFTGLAMVIALLWAGSFSPETFVTQYSDNFKRDAFEQLRPGDDLSCVTKTLGPPIDFVIVPADTRSASNNLFSGADMVKLAAFCSNGQDLVLLRFSQPKRFDYFKAYEVFIRGGKVVEKRSYWYWD